MKPSDRYAVLTFGLALVGGLACGAPADAGTASPGEVDKAEGGAVKGDAAGEGEKATPGSGEAAEKVEGPAPVLFEDGTGAYGYRDAAGEIVIPPTFAMATPFTDAVAAVVTDAGWTFIDRSGQTLATAFVFDNGADAFAEGRARITEEKVKGEPLTYGFIASSGEVVVAPTWSWALPYAEGRAAVCQGCTREQDGEHFTMKGGTWGYVDLEGKVVIPPSFDEAGPFERGRAAVKRGDASLEIGPDGKEL